VTRFQPGAIEIVEVSAEHEPGWDDPLQARIGLEDIRRLEREDIAEVASLLPGVELATNMLIQWEMFKKF